MGIGVLATAGAAEQGMRNRRMQDMTDAAATRADQEDQYQTGVRTGSRKAASDAYELAKQAADRANTAIDQANQPVPFDPMQGVNVTADGDVTSDPNAQGGLTLFKNPQTGEVFSQRAKAYGVVPRTNAQTLFEKEFSTKVREYYMQQGAPELAVKYDEWSKTATAHRYQQEVHEGLAMLAGGNKAEALSRFRDVYNSMVKDGNYGDFKDMGNGQTLLTVHNAQGQLVGQKTVSDEQLGQLATSFLSPDYIAKNFLERQTMQAKAAVQFNLEAAKINLEHNAKLSEQEQKYALERANEFVKQADQAQIDTLTGKNTRVFMDRLGQHILVVAPGQPIQEMGQNGLQPVANQARAQLMLSDARDLGNGSQFLGSPQRPSGVVAPGPAPAAAAADPSAPPVPSAPAGYTPSQPAAPQAPAAPLPPTLGTDPKTKQPYDSRKLVALVQQSSAAGRQSIVNQLAAAGVPKPQIDALMSAAGVQPQAAPAADPLAGYNVSPSGDVAAAPPPPPRRAVATGAASGASQPAAASKPQERKRALKVPEDSAVAAGLGQTPGAVRRFLQNSSEALKRIQEGD